MKNVPCIPCDANTGATFAYADTYPSSNPNDTTVGEPAAAPAAAPHTNPHTNTSTTTTRNRHRRNVDLLDGADRTLRRPERAVSRRPRSVQRPIEDREPRGGERRSELHPCV
jgi:hypothetical protein